MGAYLKACLKAGFRGWFRAVLERAKVQKRNQCQRDLGAACTLGIMKLWSIEDIILLIL